MDKQQLFRRWNELLSVKRPTLRDVFKTQPIQRMSARTSNMFFAGDNLVASVKYGSTPTPDTPLLSMMVVIQPLTLSGSRLEPGVSFEVLDGISIFGVSCECDAEAFTTQLRHSGQKGLELTTISNVDGSVDAWEIIIGKALTLRFEPYPATSKDPKASHLDTVTFAFQIPYVGAQQPFLASVL